MLLEKKNFKYNYLFIFLICILVYFSNLNVEEPDLMESRNFITAREMTIDGHWLIPTMNGNLRLEKPPLPTWITAAFSKTFQTNDNLFILRLPAAISTTAMTFFLYFLVLIISEDRELSLISALVLSTTFMVMKVGSRNTWDIYPYVFMVGFIYTLLKGIFSNHKKYFLFSAIFLTCSVMSKGPVPLYGMLLPFLLSYSFIYKDRRFLENKKNLISIIILTLALSLIWPILIYIKSPEVFSHVIKKEVGTWGKTHVQGFWYYLHIFPYTGIWFIFSVTTLFKSFMEKRVLNKKLYHFSCLWFLLTLLFLSLIPMKKERYGLPMYIPMAIMISQLIYYYIKNYNKWIKNKKDILIIRIHLVILTILNLYVIIIFYTKGVLKDNLSIFKFWNLFVIYALFFISFLYLYKKKNMKKYIFVLTISFGISLQLFIFDFINKNVMGFSIDPKLTLANVQTSKLFNQYEFYSLDSTIDIMSVWKVGKKIKILNINNPINSPIVIIGENIEQKIHDFPYDFKIIEKKEYFKSRKGNSKMQLLLVE